jgi:hypothetical protein
MENMGDDDLTFLPDDPEDAFESTVVVDADLKRHQLQDLASAKANGLLDENEVLVNVELGDSVPHGNGGASNASSISRIGKGMGPSTPCTLVPKTEGSSQRSRRQASFIVRYFAAPTRSKNRRRLGESIAKAVAASITLGSVTSWVSPLADTVACPAASTFCSQSTPAP